MQIINDSLYELVLGRGFLQQQGAVIDFKDGTFMLQPQGPVDIKAACTFEIPPKSETIVSGKIKSDLHNIIGLCQGHRVMQSLGLCVAKSLGDSHKGFVPVRLLNPSDKMVSVYKNTKIGKFFSVKEHLVPKQSVQSEKHKVPETVSVSEPSHVNSVVKQDPIKFNIDKSDLSVEQCLQLETLLKEHRHVFTADPSELGHTKVIQHHISVSPDQNPIRVRPHRASPKQRAALEQNIELLLKQDVIEPSVSPWAAPVVLVLKKDMTYRFCVDYRRLNSVTKFDSFPLLRCDDCFDALGTSQPRYYTTLDLMSGYFQVDLDESRDKTTFTSHLGTYRFKRMPQNLVGAPATFSRLVETVFRGLNWKIRLAYLDDVIVFSHTFQDHLLHLRQVFERLAESNLRLKVNKCHFAKKEVEYLGHRLSSKGISPDTSKIETIASYPTPKNPKALRSFLGLTGFYRRFIAGYAVKSSPLRKLLKKNVSFVWTQECEKAFRGLKDSLMRYPVLLS